MKPKADGMSLRKKKNPKDLIFGVSRASSGWKRGSSEAELQRCYFIISKSHTGVLLLSFGVWFGVF